MPSQEHVLERRLLKIVKILENGGAYLRAEVLKKGVLTEEGIRLLTTEVAANTKDIDSTSSSSQVNGWAPDNFVEGKWVQKAIQM